MPHLPTVASARRSTPARAERGAHQEAQADRLAAGGDGDRRRREAGVPPRRARRRRVRRRFRQTLPGEDFGKARKIDGVGRDQRVGEREVPVAAQRPVVAQDRGQRLRLG